MSRLSSKAALGSELAPEQADGSAAALRAPSEELAGLAAVPAEDTQTQAVRAFERRYPGVTFAPVLVVIPAFNEEDCLGSVLPLVPGEAAGLAVDTLLVDDGSSDRTAERGRELGAYVAELARNLGQGAALRVGYRLAREYGASFIVTLDADGQWDPGEIVPLLEPLVADEADLVLGSRILGRAERQDSVRRAGVHVFARFLRLVTRLPITDTSTGIRAMRTEVATTVRQEEPQYQASELLIGAIYRGYRIVERPVVMKKRVAGESKKGHNLLYGLRYGRVVLRTLWRESRSAKRRGRTPAR